MPSWYTVDISIKGTVPRLSDVTVLNINHFRIRQQDIDLRQKVRHQERDSNPHVHAQTHAHLYIFISKAPAQSITYISVYVKLDLEILRNGSFSLVVCVDVCQSVGV